MPGKEPDKVQREIEEILNKLDNFVPEERFIEKVRARRKRDAGPNALDRLRARVSQITLGHLMLTGLAFFLIAFFFGGPLGAAATWLWIAGLLLTGGAFVASMITGGSRQTVGKARVQRQWRGRVIEYGEPSTMDRLRSWFRRRSQR